MLERVAMLLDWFFPPQTDKVNTLHRHVGRLLDSPLKYSEASPLYSQQTCFGSQCSGNQQNEEHKRDMTTCSLHVFFFYALKTFKMIKMDWDWEDFFIFKQAWLLSKKKAPFINKKLRGFSLFCLPSQDETHCGSVVPRTADTWRTGTTFSFSALSPGALTETYWQLETAKRARLILSYLLLCLPLNNIFAFMAASSFHCSLLENENNYLNIHERSSFSLKRLINKSNCISSLN